MKTDRNYNMLDPAEQEKIRRGPHEYVPIDGKHGIYKPKPYRHQEYPKMMGKWPKPELKAFQMVNSVTVPGDLALANWQNAVIEWDRLMTASIVNSKAEEQQWLKENG